MSRKPDNTRSDFQVLNSPWAIAVVTRQGFVVSRSPSITGLFVRAGLIDSEDSRQIDPHFVAALQDQEGLRPLEWQGEGIFIDIAATGVPLDDTHLLVSIEEIADRQATSSYRVYQSTKEVFARIIAAAAHDLRSPLSSMAFNLAVLRRRWKELPEIQVTRLQDELAMACELELKAINRLIEDAAATDVEMSLEKLFDRLAEALRPLFRSKKNELNIEVDGTLRVRGAALALEHIFANLLQNAVQASKQPVRVHVRQVGIVQAIGRPDLRTVVLEVHDDGPGVPGEIRRRIFDPFFTTKSGGSGVGLCLAREAARQIGGDLRLIERAAAGACFEVRLPLVGSASDPP